MTNMGATISPDGHMMALVREGKETARDIWLVPMEGQGETLRAGDPRAFIDGPADEINPTFLTEWEMACLLIESRAAAKRNEVRAAFSRAFPTAESV